MFKADQDPKTIEWARTPPPPLLEALETLHGLFDGYREWVERDNPEGGHWTRHALSSYQTAYNHMLRAFIEEYAP